MKRFRGFSFRRESASNREREREERGMGDDNDDKVLTITKRENARCLKHHLSEPASVSLSLSLSVFLFFSSKNFERFFSCSKKKVRKRDHAFHVLFMHSSMYHTQVPSV